jgi:hypothetical protein
MSVRRPTHDWETKHDDWIEFGGWILGAIIFFLALLQMMGVNILDA